MGRGKPTDTAFVEFVAWLYRWGNSDRNTFKGFEGMPNRETGISVRDGFDPLDAHLLIGAIDQKYEVTIPHVEREFKTVGDLYEALCYVLRIKPTY